MPSIQPVPRLIRSKPAKIQEIRDWSFSFEQVVEIVMNTRIRKSMDTRSPPTDRHIRHAVMIRKWGVKTPVGSAACHVDAGIEEKSRIWLSNVCQRVRKCTKRQARSGKAICRKARSSIGPRHLLLMARAPSALSPYRTKPRPPCFAGITEVD